MKSERIAYWDIKPRSVRKRSGMICLILYLQSNSVSGGKIIFKHVLLGFAGDLGRACRIII